MLTLMKRIWTAWKGVAHRIVQAQNFVLMALVYIFAVAPVAVLLKVSRRPVVPPPPQPDGQGSLWQPVRSGRLDMDRAGRMY